MYVGSSAYKRNSEKEGDTCFCHLFGERDGSSSDGMSSTASLHFLRLPLRLLCVSSCSCEREVTLELLEDPTPMLFCFEASRCYDTPSQINEIYKVMFIY